MILLHSSSSGLHELTEWLVFNKDQKLFTMNSWASDFLALLWRSDELACKPWGQKGLHPYQVNLSHESPVRQHQLILHVFLAHIEGLVFGVFSWKCLLKQLYKGQIRSEWIGSSCTLHIEEQRCLNMC
jgi:hypothetical protein